MTGTVTRMAFAMLSSCACFLPVAATAEQAVARTVVALTDVHFDSGLRYPCFGCETGLELWEIAQSATARIATEVNASMIVYLGDMPQHGASNDTKQSDFQVVLDGLLDVADRADRPIFFVVGNNDGLGPNYCHFTFSGETAFDYSSDPTRWPVAGGAELIIDDTHLAKGFYSAYAPGSVNGPALRVLALNSVIFSKKYGYSHCDRGHSRSAAERSQQADANRQLEWIAGQLEAAETLGEKVLLAMHIPPGTDGFGGGPTWSNRLRYSGTVLGRHGGQPVLRVFLDLLDQHRKALSGAISGHTHLNGLRRLRNCDGAVIGLNLSVSAVETEYRNYPATKTFHFNGEFDWIDSRVHYATGEPAFTWAGDASFGFGENYPNDAAPGATLTEQIAAVSDASALFDEMKRFLRAGAPGMPGSRHFEAAMDVWCPE